MRRRATELSIPNQWSPRHYQLPIMNYYDAGHKRAVWVVHRRGGKDNTMLNQVAKMALRRIGAYWHVFPTHKQVRKAIWDGMDKTTGHRFIDQAFPEPLREATNNTEMKITLRNGSIIQFIGSDNYDSLVGSNPIHVTFSEWSLCKPSAWDFVRPILAENEGTAGFIYTPRGNNHGKRLLDMARSNPDWFCRVMPVSYTKALHPDVIEGERRAGMPEELIRQEYYCDFSVGMVGAFYADLIGKLKQSNGVVDFAYQHDGIYTHWDIGFTDSTAIIFWRFRPDGGIDIVDFYEAHGLPVEHYVRIILKKGYTYLGHFLPHDGNDSRYKFATNLTIKEQIRAALPNVLIVPKLSVMDGIQAGRVVLSPQARTRIHSKNCSQLVDALEYHHREYDEDERVFKSTEAETWAIHAADAFRYLSVCTQLLKDRFFAPRIVVPKPKSIEELSMDDYEPLLMGGGRL